MQLILSRQAGVVDATGAPTVLAPLDAALLAWLAIEGPTSRARLAALLWPEHQAAAARNTLRQRLHQLHKRLGGPVVTGSATLALAEGVAHDLADADTLLDGVAVEVGGEFAAWLDQQRGRRGARVRRSLVELARMAEASKDFDDALIHAGELLALEPLSEDAHRRVMRLHYLRGDRAAALMAFDRCERALKDEVGARPSAETLALLRTVEQSGTAEANPVRAGVPAAVLRPPRLIGRDAAWAALQAAWAAGQPTLVIGEGGLGKTRLVGDFAASAGRTLVVGARPGDARVVYASLSRLLRALPAPALAALAPSLRGELARVLPELGDAAPLDDGTGRTRFFNAVSALLQGLAPGLDGIVFDDLHFADDASLELLQYAAAGGRLRWILCARGAELSPGGRALIEGFEAHGPLARIELQPLTRAEVERLLDSLDLAPPAGAELAEALWRRSGGNPLFLLESLRAWLLQPPGATAGALVPAAPGVTALIERRIGRLSVQAVQLARCAAVATPDFGIDLAAHVLGLRTLDLADPWAELEAAQVLRDGAFAHDLIYESALASVPRPVAQRLHGEIAAFLEAHGGEPARVAAHWLEAGAEASALDAMGRAAAKAAAALRPREAIDWHRRASALAERLLQHECAFDHWLAVFEATMVADRSTLDEAYFVRLDSLARTPMQQLRALLTRGDFAKDANRFDEGLQLCEQAAALARSLGRRDLEVDALRGAAAHATFGGDGARAVRLLRPLVPWVIEHGSPGDQQSLFNDLAACLDMDDQPHEAREYHGRALELALRTGRFDQAAISCANLVFSLKNVGRLRAALEQAHQAQRHAASYDQARGFLFALDVMVPALLRDLGRYDEALRLGEAAVQAMPHNPGATQAAQAHLAYLWLLLGQPARARQVLAAMRAGPVVPQARPRIAQIEGRLQRALGSDPAAAFALALREAPLAARTVLQSMIALDHSLALEPGDARALCTGIEQRSAALGHDGVALAARVRGAAAATRAGDLQAAVALSRQALAAPQDIEPDELYRGELWLTAALANEGAGLVDDARHIAAQGAEWVRGAAETAVPPAFRDSFLHRNPVNRQLLALATRLRGV